MTQVVLTENGFSDLTKLKNFNEPYWVESVRHTIERCYPVLALHSRIGANAKVGFRVKYTKL